jgi:hypothetical protein
MIGENSMVKNTNRVASAFAYVAALGLAFGASAAHWELNTENDIVYATEIFSGSADDIELVMRADDETTPAPADESTRAVLTLVLPTGDNVDTPDVTETNLDVGSGAEAIVTFKLSNAVFGNTVGINDFDSTGDITIVNGSKKGGRAGTDTVSVEIIVGSDDDADNGATILLRVESLEGASALGVVDPRRTERRLGVRSRSAVTMSASVESTGRRTQRDENERVDFPEQVCRPTTEMASGCATGAGAPPADNMIASSARALTFSATDGGGGLISLSSRSDLAYGAEAAHLAGLSVVAEDTPVPMQRDGMTPFTVADGGEADINIAVLGNLRDTDHVIFDMDNDGRFEDGETLDVDEGSAGGSFRLQTTKAISNIYYVPDGGMDMERGDFKTTFDVDFDDRLNNHRDVSGEALLRYAGIFLEASAYAIPGPDNEAMDIANIRIKCEAGTFNDCDVYLDCDAQDGTSYFGQAVSGLEGGATEHLTAAEVADILGVDTWAGRLSCDVLSSNGASAQVLVRTGGALINNTYVSGK